MTNRNFCFSASILSLTGCLALHAADNGKSLDKPNIVSSWQMTSDGTTLVIPEVTIMKRPILTVWLLKVWFSRMLMPQLRTPHQAEHAL